MFYLLLINQQTKAAEILIALNPFEQISGLYSQETIAKYDYINEYSQVPHIFSIGLLIN